MRTPIALAALVLCAGPAAADPTAQLQQVAAQTAGGAAATGPEAMSSGVSLAFAEKTAAAPVRADINPQFAAQTASPITHAGPVDKKKTEVPTPENKDGFLDKAGSTLKEYTPHLLTAGIAGAAGAVVAKVAGFGLLGGIAAGAAIGLGAMWLHKKGETGAAIGAASLGLAGLALGGPVGGLVGAVAGGLAGWLLKKFFA